MPSDDPPITFKLPDTDEMSRRLQAVDSSSDVVTRFYPDLLHWGAGTMQDPGGMVFLFDSALDSYQHSHYPYPDPASIVRKIHAFIDALVDDSEGARLTKERWDQFRAPLYAPFRRPQP